ncbi:hypothetical protein EC973_004186 [Apophysomyces ossiformis]|uniref:Methyltransferase domain-containing protein n=1 Tax=Apophysomyces ossiformis TaxID=679940 RepID=A0A8H7BWX9_9FUNG|nr:hypothetical protein EC973_004186 [Apophysomyces ossiformis]
MGNTFSYRNESANHLSGEKVHQRQKQQQEEQEEEEEVEVEAKGQQQQQQQHETQQQQQHETQHQHRHSSDDSKIMSPVSAEMSQSWPTQDIRKSRRVMDKVRKILKRPQSVHGPSSLVEALPPLCFSMEHEAEVHDFQMQTHFMIKHCFGDNFSSPVRDLLSRSTSVSWDSASTNRNSWPTSRASTATSDSTQSSSLRTTWVRRPVPSRVLDIACGSGTWVLEMATEFPDAQIHGIDLHPLFPTTIKPPNAVFTCGNILERLPYPDLYFDYIHMQLVYFCFSEADWATIIKSIKRVLKPGGYVEFREAEPLMRNPGPITQAFQEPLPAGMKALYNVDVFWCRHLCEYLKNLGEMSDIHHQVVSIGVGMCWTGEIADMVNHTIEMTFHLHKPKFMAIHHISSEEFNRKVKQILLEAGKYRSYYNYYMSWARKPLIDLDQSHLNEYDDTVHSTIPRDSKGLQSLSPVDDDEVEQHNENAYDIYKFAQGFEE